MCRSSGGPVPVEWTSPDLRRQWRNTLLFFFNDTATTEIYTLSLHDALPIYLSVRGLRQARRYPRALPDLRRWLRRHDGQLVAIDRKSTRLNSSHGYISYAVFCLKKKMDSRTFE